MYDKHQYIHYTKKHTHTRIRFRIVRGILIADDVTEQYKDAKKAGFNLKALMTKNRHKNLDLLLITHGVKDMPSRNVGAHGAVFICGISDSHLEIKSQVEEFLGDSVAKNKRLLKRIYLEESGGAVLGG